MDSFWYSVDSNFRRPEIFDFCVLCGRICFFVPFLVMAPLHAAGFESVAARLFDFVGVTAIAGLIAIFYHPVILWLDRKLP
jgi:hypothetical protein